MEYQALTSMDHLDLWDVKIDQTAEVQTMWKGI